MNAAAELPLHDIHLPEAVSWWPPALGWWALPVLLALLTLLAVLVHRRRRRKAPLRAAQRELKALRRSYRKRLDDPALAAELSRLLRRVAVTQYPRAEAARLTGEDWLRFLDRPLAGSQRSEAFTRGAGRALMEAPYNPNAQSDGRMLLDLAAYWIRRAGRSA